MFRYLSVILRNTICLLIYVLNKLTGRFDTANNKLLLSNTAVSISVLILFSQSNSMSLISSLMLSSPILIYPLKRSSAKIFPYQNSVRNCINVGLHLWRMLMVRNAPSFPHDTSSFATNSGAVVPLTFRPTL